MSIFSRTIIILFIYESAKLSRLVEAVTTTCTKSEGFQIQDTLVFSHVFFRHGDRSPLFDFPHNRVNITIKWPTGFGQITHKGKMQGFELGQFLRRRYSSLIRDFYHPDDIYMLSSDYDRTIVTALSVLAGLYHPVKEKWHSSIFWDPIPIRTLPHEIDNIIAFAAPCHKYKQELDCYRIHGKGRTVDSNHKEFYAYLSNHTGVPLSEFNFEKVSEIFDTLYIQDVHGLELPPWATRPAYEKQESRLMRKMSEYSFSALTDSETTMKLRGGPLLREIVRNLEAHTQQQYHKSKNHIEKFKLRLYSGHDTTISTLLQVFGVYNYELVPYTATVMIELYKRSYVYGNDGKTNNSLSPPPLGSSCCSNTYFIKLFFKNCTKDDNVYELPIPFCQDVTEFFTKNPNLSFRPGCSVEKLKAIKAHILKGDWHKLCRLGTGCRHCMNFKRQGSDFSNFEGDTSVSTFIYWLTGMI